MASAQNSISHLLSAPGSVGRPARRTVSPYDCNKGRATRMAILEQALDIASSDGLQAITFGVLAEHMKMARSGVFAHFGSREKLVLDVLDLYHARFAQLVFFPSLRKSRGLPRLRSMFDLWSECFVVGGDRDCIFISAAARAHHQEDAVRDKLGELMQDWKNALHRCVVQAMEAGQLRQDADAWQMVYEIYGLVLALHHETRFMKAPRSMERARLGLERVIEGYKG